MGRRGSGALQVRVFYVLAAVAGFSFTVLCMEYCRQMRENQTVAFVDRMEDQLYRCNHGRMTVREAAEHLKKFVDRSDPDITLPNVEHLLVERERVASGLLHTCCLRVLALLSFSSCSLQTAERARAAGKPDWFQLTVRQCPRDNANELFSICRDPSVAPLMPRIL